MNTRQKKKLLKRRHHIDRLNRNVNIKRSLDVNYVLIRRVLREIDKAILGGENHDETGGA